MEIHRMPLKTLTGALRPPQALIRSRAGAEAAAKRAARVCTGEHPAKRTLYRPLFQKPYWHRGRKRSGLPRLPPGEGWGAKRSAAGAEPLSIKKIAPCGRAF